MLNQIVLIGRIANNLDLKKTGEDGNCVLNFSIAVQRNYTDKNGNTPVDFINCEAWNKQAENLVKYCKKGSLINVLGNLHQKRYKGFDDNGKEVEKTTYVVRASNVIFLDSKKDGSTQNTQNTQNGQNNKQNQKPKQEDFIEDFNANFDEVMNDIQF